MTRLAIFDCDGTLVDSQHNICAAVEGAFAAAGLASPPRERIRDIVGLSLEPAMAALAPDTEPGVHRALAQQYRARFQAMRAESVIDEPLFPGMTELLASLADKGWKLGIATGKSERGLSSCLATNKLGRSFCTMQTADRHPSKPDPAMLEAAIVEAKAQRDLTVMIGDTSYDMAMARAAGVRAIGVTWGSHDRARLLVAGADHVVDEPDQIRKLLERTDERE